MGIHSCLVEACDVRRIEWSSGADRDLAYYGNELGGEVGEVFELFAFRPATAGIDRTDLADELGDVVICAINAGTVAGVTPEEFETPHATLQQALLRLGTAAGRAQNFIKKLERERHGMPGSRATPAELATELGHILSYARALATHFSIDLDTAVRVKFNKTSNKVGLTTFVLVPE